MEIYKYPRAPPKSSSSFDLGTISLRAMEHRCNCRENVSLESQRRLQWRCIWNRRPACGSASAGNIRHRLKWNHTHRAPSSTWISTHPIPPLSFCPKESLINQPLTKCSALSHAHPLSWHHPTPQISDVWLRRSTTSYPTTSPAPKRTSQERTIHSVFLC